MNKKSMLFLVSIAIILIFIVTQVPTKSLTILSVDRIYLHERGVGEAGEELKGGWWRVTATTKDTANVRFIQLNHTKMEEEGKFVGDFPDDVVVQGEIYFSVWQSQEPYWVIPPKLVDTITVTPRMAGCYAGIFGEKDETVVAEPVTVSLWELDLAQKKVVVPFTVQALKISGENVASLTTDDPRAEQQGILPIYRFKFSYSDISSGEMTEKITFYNPQDTTEVVKLNLVWVFGDYDRYSWNENFLFVTSETGGPISSTNTFNIYDKRDIVEELDYTQGSDWSFYHYWFGGGNTFLGCGAAWAGLFPELGYGYDKLIHTWDDGTVKPTVMVGIFERCIGEGYVSEAKDVWDMYQYAGWYTPAPDNGEGVDAEDWWNKRYPTQPNIYSDRENLKPTGLSICNYLASSVYPPNHKSENLQYHHIPFERRNPDYWGHGCEGDIPSEYKVYMPTAARSWLFTLDVSTEIVDTVVVEQNYIDVELQDFNLDRSIVYASDEATVTVELHNKSPYRGAASVGISPPDALRFTCTITGGDGSLTFEADEPKTVTFKILNKGLLTEDQTGTFTFKVVNDEPRTTAQKQFDLTFKAGLAIPKTQLNATVLDADSNQPLSGILVQAWWGLNEEHYQSASTHEGLAIINMEYYDGTVRIVASDSAGVYASQEKTVSVHEGSNKVTFRLVKGDVVFAGFPWWLTIIIVIIAGAVIIMYAIQRKKGGDET